MVTRTVRTASRASGRVVVATLAIWSVRVAAVLRRFLPDRARRDPLAPKICLFAALGGAHQRHMPGLGDLIEKTAIVKLLLRRYPASTIALVADPAMMRRFGSFLSDHAFIHELIACPQPEEAPVVRWLAFVGHLRKRRFDLCVIDPDSAVGALEAWLCGMRERIGVPRDAYEARLLTRTVVVRPTCGVGPDLLDFTEAFARALSVRIPLGPRDLTPWFRFDGDAPPATSPTTWAVAVHAGGDRTWNRRWPLDGYQEICRRLCTELGATVYLVGGADERPESEQIVAGVKGAFGNADIFNVAGGTLNEMATYLAAASLFVGNDSAPLHMAGALGKPVIAVCGPIGPAMWQRLYDGEIVSRRFACQEDTTFASTRHDERRFSCAEFACDYAYDPAQPTYPKCLAAIRVDDVWRAIVRALPRVPAQRRLRAS